IAQALKDEMWRTGNWEDLDADMKEALEMIQHKIARILNGDPRYADNWLDIAGYARLVEDRILEEDRAAPEESPHRPTPEEIDALGEKQRVEDVQRAEEEEEGLDTDEAMIQALKRNQDRREARRQAALREAFVETPDGLFDGPGAPKMGPQE
ncbi:MAG: hypothetical protein IMY75_12755, partial [Chloroflexi bacterium]|nr:hypothetical protein [Chloroflexota bacterium]